MPTTPYTRHVDSVGLHAPGPSPKSWPTATIRLLLFPLVAYMLVATVTAAQLGAAVIAGIVAWRLGTTGFRSQREGELAIYGSLSVLLVAAAMTVSWAAVGVGACAVVAFPRHWPCARQTRTRFDSSDKFRA